MAPIVLQTTQSSCRATPQSCYREKGSILFVGLILLFILSLVGITSIRTTAQQERMSANLRDRTIAFQAAETALAAAEKTYFSTDTNAVINDSGTFSSGPTCTAGALKYCPSTGVCAGATTTPAPYLVANGLGDGADPTFWRNTYKDAWATCGYNTGVEFVASSDYSKPGHPYQSPRYMIEQLNDPAINPVKSYRVTAIGYGFTDSAIVILQATYSEQ